MRKVILSLVLVVFLSSGFLLPGHGTGKPPITVNGDNGVGA